MLFFFVLEAQPADVEICYNRAQQNKTVDAYCGKIPGSEFG